MYTKNKRKGGLRHVALKKQRSRTTPLKHSISVSDDDAIDSDDVLDFNDDENADSLYPSCSSQPDLSTVGCFEREINEVDEQIACSHVRHSVVDIATNSLNGFYLSIASESSKNPNLLKVNNYLFTPCSSNDDSPNENISSIWIREMHKILDRISRRPKKLLVFLNPNGGKKQGRKIFKKVNSLFEKCGVHADVFETKRSNEARDYILCHNVTSYDGIICVGGDGTVSEVVNGLCLFDYWSSYDVATAKICSTSSAVVPNIVDSKKVDNNCNHTMISKSSFSSNELPVFSLIHDDDDGEVKSVDDSVGGCCSKVEKPDMMLSIASLPALPKMISHFDPMENIPDCSDLVNKIKSTINPETILRPCSIRIGIIPAGSTDTVVYTVSGVRDPLTLAVHIILGKGISVDASSIFSSNQLSSVVISLLGYGWFGDVLEDSDLYRWMGPARYTFSGVKKTLGLRPYGGKVYYRLPFADASQSICYKNCSICSEEDEMSEINSGLFHFHSPTLKENLIPGIIS